MQSLHPIIVINQSTFQSTLMKSFVAPEGKYILDFELNCDSERNSKDQKPTPRTCILNHPKVDFFDTKKFV
jgi:hypothetical protein